MIAPILTFTSGEVWQFAPAALRSGTKSVQLAGWPEAQTPAEGADAIRDAYAVVLEVREAMTKALEDARNDKVVGKSQEAAVRIAVPSDKLSVLEDRGADAIAELLIVASVELEEGENLAVSVYPASGEKCPRCWNHRELGANTAFPEVCERCAAVLASS
jgi:isoleucyl-tRNA synthetase